jgi:carboxypeptidase Taq
MDSYAKFLCRLKEIATLRSVAALLRWDQETHMPPAGAEDRSEQSALLSTMAHEKFVSSEMADLLEALRVTEETASEFSEVRNAP